MLFSTCQVCKQFTEAGFMADADLDSGCLLNKKIRNAQLAQYNFILGEKIDSLMYIWLTTDWKAFSAHFAALRGSCNHFESTFNYSGYFNNIQSI